MEEVGMDPRNPLEALLGGNHSQLEAKIKEQAALIDRLRINLNKTIEQVQKLTHRVGELEDLAGRTRTR